MIEKRPYLASPPKSKPKDMYGYWVSVVIIGLISIMGLTFMLKSSAAPSPTARLPWDSGLVVGTPAQLSAWENFRGLRTTVAMAYTERWNGWTNIESAGWILGYYKTSPEKLVISQPFWPEKSGGSLAACAAGTYDSHWKAYGSTLASSGRNATTITRLAWEFNGNWFEWSATDPTAWKGCWRKVVTAVRSTAPGAKFEWAINAHGSQTSGGNAWNSYPGDDVVDYVGIDPYDAYPASTTAAAFDKQCNEAHGLCYLIKYAREHNKKVGVGEWGVARTPAQGGGGAGDNPLYIQKMYETFYAARDVMGYETYFNSQEYGNALFNPRQNPNSADRYVALFGANSPALGTPVPSPTPPAPTPSPSPTPTPPTPPPSTSGTINNTAFTYSSGWQSASNSESYQSDDQYSSTAGATYSLSFTGTQAKIYTTKASHHGIFAVKIDNGSETTVDLYSATRAGQQLVYTSPTLTSGTHTITVRVTGTKNSASSGTVVVADRIDITGGGSTSPQPTPPPATPTCTKAGDANCDGRINAIDNSLIISNDGKTNFPAGDFNKDGVIGSADMAILIANWTW